MICTHHEKMCNGNEETCRECGKILKVTYDPAKMQLYEDYKLETIQFPYARVNRFAHMLNSIVMGTEGSNDKKMFQFLGQQDCTTVPNLIASMQRASLVDKRYTSLHVFMRGFLPTRVQELIPTAMDSNTFLLLRKRIRKSFTDIEFALMKKRLPFLNYRFVLDVLLHFYSLGEFRCFVKPLKCAHRVLHSVKLFNQCQIRIGGTVSTIPETWIMSPQSLFRPEVHRV